MRLVLFLTAAICCVSCSPTSTLSASTSPSISKVTTITELPEKARITLRNVSERDIMVGVRGPESQMVLITRLAVRVITLPPGRYRWAVTAENTKTQVGNKTFEPGQQYVWNFKLN